MAACLLHNEKKHTKSTNCKSTKFKKRKNLEEKCLHFFRPKGRLISKLLKNEYAKIGVDTAENEPSKVSRTWGFRILVAVCIKKLCREVDYQGRAWCAPPNQQKEEDKAYEDKKSAIC